MLLALLTSVNIFNYVATDWAWTKIKQGMYCPKKISNSKFHDFNDCTKYCGANGLTRLTYYPWNKNCFCCTASSEIKESAQSTAGVYEVKVNGN